MRTLAKPQQVRDFQEKADLLQKAFEEANTAVEWYMHVKTCQFHPAGEASRAKHEAHAKLTAAVIAFVQMPDDDCYMEQADQALAAILQAIQNLRRKG